MIAGSDLFSKLGVRAHPGSVASDRYEVQVEEEVNKMNRRFQHSAVQRYALLYSQEEYPSRVLVFSHYVESEAIIYYLLSKQFLPLYLESLNGAIPRRWIFRKIVSRKGRRNPCTTQQIHKTRLQTTNQPRVVCMTLRSKGGTPKVLCQETPEAQKATSRLCFGLLVCAG